MFRIVMPVQFNYIAAPPSATDAYVVVVSSDGRFKKEKND